MQIDWWTLGLQAVNFLVLVWLLWRFLYRPVKEVIERRKELAERAFADAEAKRNEAEAAKRQFEEDQARLVRERQGLLKSMHEEMQSERDKILQAARLEADALSKSARQDLAKERETAFTEIRDEVTALAAELASKLLRKAGSELSNGAFLEPLERQLKDLPAEERERLQKDLAAENGRLTVVTAAALPAADRDRWGDRLGDCFGQTIKTEFVIDPDILGGAELRFPHAVLKLTWADQLQRAKELLRENEPTA